ncbi:MAG TPA: acyl carrier protein, partial [Pseudobdellovibrionaceae bacterium]|nr:acyl carrier protein [Pseudobdellovibrionaceae bacterium]
MEKEQARSALTDKVIDVIFTSLNLKHIDRTTVTDETHLVQGGLNLDSIDILELIVNLEQNFNIKLEESEAYAQHFRSIGSVIDFIQMKQQASH